jgi:DNA repair exonuclease SbcCD ATPase subunit
VTDTNARRYREEAAVAADALSVQLRVLEEARPRIEVRVQTEPSLPRDGEPFEPFGQDADTIAFSVMMLASESAQEDLKAVMRHVREINEAKERLRASMAELKEAQTRQAGGLTDRYDERTDGGVAELDPARVHRHGQPVGSVSDLDAILPLLVTAYGISLEREVDALRDEMDGLTELGEQQQLKMQMYMERMSRMESVLANLMKKLADTSRGLIQNMK